MSTPWVPYHQGCENGWPCFWTHWCPFGQLVLGADDALKEEGSSQVFKERQWWELYIFKWYLVYYGDRCNFRLWQLISGCLKCWVHLVLDLLPTPLLVSCSVLTFLLFLPVRQLKSSCLRSVSFEEPLEIFAKCQENKNPGSKLCKEKSKNY